MALLDLWRSSREQLFEKHVQQIIAFAGDGRLCDGSAASAEFCAFLGQIPTGSLTRYASECLTDSFTNSGLALQDLVNEIGRRLGFDVAHGRYRGVSGQIGFDGLWRSPDGHALVVEVKMTDAYRIDLDTVAGYRAALLAGERLLADRSSILIIVGRQDTGDVEAQIRGSRHAWDVRLISTEALIRLLAVKEEVEDPRIQTRIHDVLRPREFTKLDDIVDILFSTAEDFKEAQISGSEIDADPDSLRKPKFTPVAFHAACIERVEHAIRASLVKRSRATFFSPDRPLHVICAVSREHILSQAANYWFAFHPHQQELLREKAESYLALGCGSAERLLLIPFVEFEKWLGGMNETIAEDRSYKHISVSRLDDRFELIRRQGVPRVALTKYFLTGTAGQSA